MSSYAGLSNIVNLRAIFGNTDQKKESINTSWEPPLIIEFPQPAKPAAIDTYIIKGHLENADKNQDGTVTRQEYEIYSKEYNNRPKTPWDGDTADFAWSQGKIFLDENFEKLSNIAGGFGNTNKDRINLDLIDNVAGYDGDNSNISLEDFTPSLPKPLKPPVIEPQEWRKPKPRVENNQFIQMLMKLLEMLIGGNKQFGERWY